MFTNISKFEWILIGLLFYESGSYLYAFYGYSPIILNMVGTLFFLVAFFKIGKNSARSLGTWYNFLLFLTIIMILRGSLIGNYLPQNGSTTLDTSLYAIFRHLFFDHYVFAFLMPCVALIPIDQIKLESCKKFGVILGILSLALAIYHLPTLVWASTYAERHLQLGVDSSISIRGITNGIFIGVGFTIFMSYCFQYINDWKKYVFPVVLGAYFLCTVAGAGRGDSVMTLLYVFFFFYFLFKCPYNAKGRSYIDVKVILVAIIACVGIYYLYSNTIFFDALMGRIFEDQSTGSVATSGREGFTSDMIRDFDGNILFWLFGKGLNGTYFTTDGNYNRGTIEWGYMYLILKGGIIYLLTYCVVLLKAARSGFYKSNNLVCKAFAIMCFLRVLSLIPFGFPSVSVEFFLIWIGVKIINTEELLLMSNDEIKAYFRL